MNSRVSMRESGNRWLGAVPEHWELKKLKFLADTVTSGVWGEDPTPDDEGVPVATTANIDRQGELDVAGMNRRVLSREDRRKGKCEPGDTIVVKSSGSATNVISGKAGFVRRDHGELYFSNFTMRVRPRPLEAHARFAWYFLSSEVVQAQVRWMVSTTTYPNLQVPEYLSLLFPKAPLQEQAAIADFVDCKTSAVDALIRKRERLLDLLHERRLVLITQAVTKGLDPNASMRESGVPWIGSIPSHWRLLPAKRLGWYRGGAGFPDEEQGRPGLALPFFKVKDLAGGGIESPESAENTVDLSTARRLHATVFPVGTIVFAKIGAALLLRRFRRLSVAACIDNNMMGWVLDRRLVDPAFVLYATALLPFDLIVNPGTVPSLGGFLFGAQLLPVPDLEEQRRIVQHLDTATAHLDRLLALNSEAAGRLREYRQALISAAVTGKLDLSKEAA